MKSWFAAKPYWLKGGIIGVILSLLLALLATICFIINPGVEGLVCLLLPLGFTFSTFFILDLGVYFADLGINFGEFFYVFLTHLTSLVVFFLTGTLIGWVIGKIKSKATQL